MANREIFGEGLLVGERLAADAAQRAGNLFQSAVGDELKAGSIGTSIFSNADRLAENAKLETLFRERPIVYDPIVRSSEQRPGLRTGHIVDDSGKPHAVFERRLPSDKRDSAEMMYRVHANLPFANYFPVTIQTPDGRMIQERVGKSLLDQGTKFDKMFLANTVKPGQDPKSLEWLYKAHPEFHDQLQLTVAERLALDLNDLGYHNIGMTARKGHLLMANLDITHPFGSRWEPLIPAVVPPVVGEKFAPITSAALSGFYRMADSKAGRAFLKGNGVDNSATRAISERLEAMLARGRFKRVGE